MIPRAWIQQLTFSDGTTIELEKNDIIVVVGPNNSGKSASLRAIRDILTSQVTSPVISNLTFGREGEVRDVSEWLSSFTRIQDSRANDPLFQAFGAQVIASQIRSWWGQSSCLHSMARFFCHLLTADERLQAANPTNNIPILEQPLTHPIHFLAFDDRVENRLSAQFRQAFGVDLIVNRFAGSQIPLHVGQRPTPAQGEDRLSHPYVQEIMDLPTLHTQGDGMRSFAGVLLNTAIGRESILLIDEPEAFLHPPQARHLGRTLVADKPDSRQLFLATHSGDVLRGVLDPGSDNVRVIRISRSGDVNYVRQLDNNKINEFWNDPLLKYSNILDGLFHEMVIVCEADADARFYSAVADAVVDSQGPDARRPDFMFTHCGGKDRLPVVVQAMHEIDVPVAVVVDFDVLNDLQPLRDIVIAAGGDWSSVESVWRQVKTAVDSKKPELNASDVIDEINKVLAGVQDVNFPISAKRDIQKIFRRSSPWATAKEVGRSFIPHGQATQVYEQLVQTLRGYGIFIVEVGELECFVPSVGNHGPRWVNEALKKDLAIDPELEKARRFVSLLLEQ